MDFKLYLKKYIYYLVKAGNEMQYLVKINRDVNNCLSRKQ